MRAYDWLWYRVPKYWAFPLLPLSILYYLVLLLRRLIYFLKSPRPLSVPVIVVGNLSVGGTGKTPLVIHLVKCLQRCGKHVGVVSRAYGAVGGYDQAIEVSDDTSFRLVGDEPKLIYKETGCHVAIAKQLYKAAKFLIDTHQVEVIVSDDGLQHLALERTIEIITIDGSRAFGNGWLLPAGPLREPISRIKSADFVVINGNQTDNRSFNISHPHIYQMQMAATAFYAPAYDQPVAIDYFQGQRVHACAALANPERFFGILESLGIELETHTFRDHYVYRAMDFSFEKQLAVIMTAKDGIKWIELAEQGNKIEANSWILETQLQIDKDFERTLLTRLGYYDDN